MWDPQEYKDQHRRLTAVKKYGAIPVTQAPDNLNLSEMQILKLAQSPGILLANEISLGWKGGRCGRWGMAKESKMCFKICFGISILVGNYKQ